MVAPGTLPYRLVQVPFSAGLQQKHDPRSLQEPYLDIARDVEFDNIGGLQTRKPFFQLGYNVIVEPGRRNRT